MGEKGLEIPEILHTNQFHFTIIFDLLIFVLIDVVQGIINQIPKKIYI